MSVRGLYAYSVLFLSENEVNQSDKQLIRWLHYDLRPTLTEKREGGVS